MYETEEGRVPFSEWMDSVENQQVYGVVMARLQRVELGNLGDHHSVGGGVCELVIDFGPGYRIYFGQDGKQLIILLIGGKKSSQRSDIREAQGYWRDYNA